MYLNIPCTEEQVIPSCFCQDILSNYPFYVPTPIHYPGSQCQRGNDLHCHVRGKKRSDEVIRFVVGSAFISQQYHQPQNSIILIVYWVLLIKQISQIKFFKGFISGIYLTSGIQKESEQNSAYIKKKDFLVCFEMISQCSPYWLGTH